MALNYLKPIQSQIPEIIIKTDVADTLQKSLPTEITIEEPKDPDDAPEGNETTKGRQRVKSVVSDEAKEANKKAKEDAKKAKEDAEKAALDAVNNAVANNKERFTQIMMDIAELGISLGELTITCVALPLRLALVPVSIIGSCPVGPTVQPSQLTMTLKQLKEIGDDLGTKYSKAQAAWNKLGLDKAASALAAGNPLLQKIPGSDSWLVPLTTALNLVNTVFNIAKPGILAVGGGVCSVASASGAAINSDEDNYIRPLSSIAPIASTPSFFIEGSDESGEEPQMDAPDVEFEADPEACFNFKQKTGTSGCIAANCSNFTPLDKSSTTPDCNNCSKYKPFHKQLTIRLRENTKEIYGSDDLFLKGTSFSPTPGSLKYRCSTLEFNMTNNVVWSISSGFEENGGYIWIDIKNSIGQVFSPQSEFGNHSTGFYTNNISSYIDSGIRLNLSYYSNLSETNKETADRINRGVPSSNSIWAIEVESGDLWEDITSNDIPLENRVDGMSCVVFNYKDSSGNLNRVWFNSSLFKSYYNFSTQVNNLDDDGKTYCKLGFTTAKSRYNTTSVLSTLDFSATGAI